MKDAYYFSHDSNAKADPKILAMLSVYGMLGYGWYWAIIEMLREQEGYMMDITGKYSYNAFALTLMCDVETAHKFINDCVNEFKLFESDGKYFWSESLIRRMKNWEEKSEKARQAANIRWSKNKDADALRSQCESNAKKVKEKKVKESKVKEKKVKEYKKNYSNFVTLSDEEYAKLVNLHGEDFTQKYIEKLNNYKGSTGKTYKSDYMTILNWVINQVKNEQQKGVKQIATHQPDVEEDWERNFFSKPILPTSGTGTDYL